MLKRVSLTMSVLMTLCGLYVLYSQTVTPLLTPLMRADARQTRAVADEVPFEPPAGNMEDAERFLPQAAWAARAKFQIHLSNGVLFSNNWRPIDDSRETFEFKPFAMIWFDATDLNETLTTEKQPLTVIADAGLIRFASKFDPVNQKPGRVIEGKLEGAVHIAGQDGLTVHGHNVFFSERSQKLWSDSPIDFTYQQHRGHADHGLQVDLLPSTEAPKPDQMLLIGGLRNVQLRGPVQMELQTDAAPLRISCDEKFDFHPESKMASFVLNVIASRETAPGETDSMQFKFLDLLLDDGRDPNGVPGVGGDAPSVVPAVRSNSGTVSVADADRPTDHGSNSQLGSGHWSVKEVRGSSDQRGKIVSERSGLTALMSNLRYDVVSRHVRLKDANDVIVRQSRQGWELRCPDVTLIQTADNQLESAEGHGKGRLVRKRTDTDEIELDARWRERFTMKRVPNSDLDLLELHDRAVIKQPTRNTGLAADLIRLWFERPQRISPSRSLEPAQENFLSLSSPKSAADGHGPVWRAGDVNPPRTIAENSEDSRPPLVDLDYDAADRGPLDAEVSTPRVSANTVTSRSVPDADSSQFRPRQLQALANVIVVSPQMNCRTPQLTIDFTEATTAPSALAVTELTETPPREVTPASNLNNSTVASQPARNSEPLELNAESIRAKVQLAPRANAARSQTLANSTTEGELNAEVMEIWTEGHVEIQQAQGDEPDALHLTGQRLHLRNAGREGQIVHLTGQPAVIRDRGLDLEGSDVFLDRAQNLTWIEGAGTLRLPVNNDLDGRKLAAPALLTILWKERMEFDGLTATFLDDVKASLNDSRLQCQEMEVVLAQRILFRGDSSNPQAEVRRVICKDGVELDHSEYAKKELTEIQHGRFAQLLIDQKTNRMEAIGPGEVALWRPGRGNRAALAPRATMQANRPLESETASWDFTRVTFFGKTIGNIRDRQTTFNDRVRILYGPVAHPLDTIDPDNLPRDGGEMQCETLTILQRRDEATKKSWVELKADDNVKLEGRSFHARADSISYDESKELYTLRSAGDRQVTIWRQTIPGGDYQEASGKSIWFIPSQNKLKLNQATGIRGSN